MLDLYVYIIKKIYILDGIIKKKYILDGMVNWRLEIFEVLIEIKELIFIKKFFIIGYYI